MKNSQKNYTTGKNIEYLESTMETLVFDILVCLQWLGTNHTFCDFNVTLTCSVMDEK